MADYLCSCASYEMVRLTARQSTLIFSWLDPRPTLACGDVVRLGLSLDRLVSYGFRSTDLLTLQPDPAQWAQHAGAGLKHARLLWANRFFTSELTWPT